MDTITGIITRIESVNAQSECIFFLSTTATGVKRNSFGDITCRFFADACVLHKPVSVIGAWDGDIFMVSSMDGCFIDCKTSVKYLVSACEGIGIRTADQLVNFYGSDLYSHTAADMEQLIKRDFPRLSVKKAAIVAKAVARPEDYFREVENLVYPAGGNYLHVCRLSHSGPDVAERLAENPYKTGRYAGMSFKICDRIAFSGGMSAENPVRIYYMIMEVLERAGKCGHTCLPYDVFLANTEMLARYSVYRGEIAELCILSILLEGNAFSVCNGVVALKSVADEEAAIGNSLRMLSDVPICPYKGPSFTDMLAETQTALSIVYGRDQLKAFEVVHNSISIVTGDPGTGKTSFLKGVLYIFTRCFPGKKISLCAPTGRAAKRLSEATGYPASTIHRLVDYRPFEHGTYYKDRSNPVDADLIIVDEMSMVGTHIMCILMGAVRPGTRLVFVGDENQLQSVESGNVLHDLIDSGNFPVYRLLENYRQAGTVSLYDNSKRILKGEAPRPDTDFEILNVFSGKEAFEQIRKLAEMWYHKDFPYDMQIIEPTYNGEAGIHQVNRFMQDLFVVSERKKLSGCEFVPARFYESDKIIFTATDYGVGYANGEFGVIKKIDEEGYTVDCDGELVQILKTHAANMSLAYSCSIHKTQGSENRVVIIYLPEKPKNMLKRRLLYTAVTRASEKVYLICENNALDEVLKHGTDDYRYTGLGYYLDWKK